MMSDVKRYWVPHNTLADQSGWHQDDTCVVQDWAYDRVVAERDALQQRLNAADQRIDELERGEKAPLDPPQPITEQFIEDHLGKMPDQLRDAAKMIGIERMPPMEYDEP